MEQVEKKKKRKDRCKWLVLLLLFLLLAGIYPIIDKTSYYFDVKRSELVSVPHDVTKEVNESLPVQKDLCNNVSFRYSTVQGNVVTKGSKVSPNLILSNQENEWGYFTVKFYYMSEKEFPYAKYGGSNLLEKYASGEIRLEDAKFSSEVIRFYIGPREAVLVDNETYNSGGEKEYWAIADIIEPKRYQCLVESAFVNVAQNKTFTEYRTERITRTVKEYMTLREHFKIAGYGSWIVISFMFCLIITLIILVFERYRN